MHFSRFIFLILAWSLLSSSCRPENNQVSGAEKSGELTKQTTELGYKEIEDAWKDVGYVGRYKKYCPELKQCAVFIDDYNSLLVFYDEQNQYAWLSGTTDNYQQFALNGVDLIKNNYKFSELIFYHDGKNFTTAKVDLKNANKFAKRKSESWAHGWAMKDTDTLLIKGEMMFAHSQNVGFLLEYSPSKGWHLSTAKSDISAPRYDVFLFAKEPIYKQLQQAFEKKNEITVLVKRPPWQGLPLKLQRATKLEKTSKAMLISVEKDHLLFGHEKVTSKKAMTQRLNDYKNMFIATELLDEVRIEIHSKSNDELLRYLLENLEPGIANYRLFRRLSRQNEPENDIK